MNLFALPELSCVIRVYPLATKSLHTYLEQLCVQTCVGVTSAAGTLLVFPLAVKPGSENCRQAFFQRVQQSKKLPFIENH